MISTNLLFRGLGILKTSVLSNFPLRTKNICPFTFYLSDYNTFSTEVDKDKCILVEEISNLSPSLLNCDEEKKSAILDDINSLLSSNKNVPKFIKVSDVVDIAEFSSRSQRLKYLKYLFKKEMKKRNEIEKKRKKNVEKEKQISAIDRITYGLGKNTFLLRAWKRNVMKFYEKKLANSVIFGQKIVIDLSYDGLMWKKERKACASQIRFLYYDNKLSRNPYDLYICNADPNSRCVQYLCELMPNIDKSFATLSEKSYLELFPKDSLVYLSPHAPETLKTYDHKAVYIIGGFVDTVKRDHVSSCKAKEEGIKSYSLPLDEYILWGHGCKSLSINQVFNIMHTFKDTGDWKEAFKHIPKRKLRRIEANSVENQLVSDKLYVTAN